MAEHVRARITAAKVGVGLAFAGLIAGIVDRVRPQPEQLQAISLTAKHFLTLSQLNNKITSADVKNHTLLLKDMKAHQVASYAKVTDAFIKMNRLAGQLAQEKVNLSAFEEKASSQLIHGHGSVFSGVQDVKTSGPSLQLVKVPGWVTVSGNYHNGDIPSIHIVSLAASPIVVSWNDGQKSDQQTIEQSGDAADLDFPTDPAAASNLITAQLLNGANHPLTLTLSMVSDPGGASGRFVAQALLGN